MLTNVELEQLEMLSDKIIYDCRKRKYVDTDGNISPGITNDFIHRLDRERLAAFSDLIGKLFSLPCPAFEIHDESECEIHISSVDPLAHQTNTQNKWCVVGGMWN